jgi:hypothetical protein
MIIISTGYRSFDVRASSVSKKSKHVVVLKTGKMYDMNTPYPHKEVIGETKAAIENFMLNENVKEVIK